MTKEKDCRNHRQVLIVGNIVDSLPTLVIMFLIFINQLAIWHLYAARPTDVGNWNDTVPR